MERSEAKEIIRSIIVMVGVKVFHSATDMEDYRHPNGSAVFTPEESATLETVYNEIFHHFDHGLVQDMIGEIYEELGYFPNEKGKYEYRYSKGLIARISAESER